MKRSILPSILFLGLFPSFVGCGSRPTTSVHKTAVAPLVKAGLSDDGLVFDHLPRGKTLGLILALPSGSSAEAPAELGSSHAALQGLQYKGQSLNSVMNRLGVHFETWVEPTSAILAIRGPVIQATEALLIIESTLQTAEVRVAPPVDHEVDAKGGNWVGPLLNLSYSGHALGFLPTTATQPFKAQLLQRVVKTRFRPELARLYVVGDKSHRPSLEAELPVSLKSRKSAIRKPTDAVSLHPKTAVQVVRTEDGSSQVSLAIPVNIDTPETAAQADLLALIIRSRIQEQASARRLTLHGLSSLVFAPASTGRVLVNVRADTRHIDVLWKTIFGVLRDLGIVPPNRVERLAAAHVLERQVELLDARALTRARRLVHLSELWGNPLASRSRWHQALLSTPPLETTELLTTLARPEKFTAIVSIPKAHHEGEAGLYAESLQEHAKKILYHTPKEQPEPIVQIRPNLRLVSAYQKNRSHLGIHVHLNGGRHQVSEHLVGVSYIAAALLSIRLPRALVTDQNHKIGVSLITSPRDLSASLAAIANALGRVEDWTAQEFEAGRRQALGTLDRLSKDERARFLHQLERHLNRNDGWPAPSLDEIRAGIVSVTPGQVRAWYERYVTDTPTVLGITGNIEKQRVYSMVRAILGSKGRLTGAPITHIRPVQKPTKSATLVVTSQRPRGVMVYELQNPSRIERATVHVIAQGVQSILNKRNGSARVTAQVREGIGRIRLLVQWTGAQGSTPATGALTGAIDKLCQTRLPQADFLAWRNRYVSQMSLALTNPMHRARWLTDQAVIDSSYVSLRPIQTWRTISDGVSLADVQRVAKKLFLNPNKPPIRLDGMSVHSLKVTPKKNKEKP